MTLTEQPELSAEDQTLTPISDSPKNPYSGPSKLLTVLSAYLIQKSEQERKIR